MSTIAEAILYLTLLVSVSRNFPALLTTKPRAENIGDGVTRIIRMKKPKKKKLTLLQKKFCDILLLMELAGKVNKRLAYEMAGYKCRGETARVEAERSLQIPHVLAYLSRARARVKRVIEKTEAEIIAQFEKLGFSEITDFVTWNKDGLKLKPSKDIPKDKIPALKSITIDEQEYTNKKGKKGVTRRIKVDLHNPKGSLDSLAKIKGMMKLDAKEIASFALAMHEAMKDQNAGDDRGKEIST